VPARSDAAGAKLHSLARPERPGNLNDRRLIRDLGGMRLVLVETNLGWELDLLDVVRNRSAWAAPTFLDRSPVEPSALAVDDRFVYVPAGDGVRKVRLADGGTAVVFPLPLDAGDPPFAWRATRLGDALLVYPAQPRPAGSPWIGLASRPRNWTSLAEWLRYPARAVASYHDWMRRRFPLLVLDAGDGRPRGRFDFEARGPRARVAVAGDRVAVFVEGRAWVLTAAANEERPGIP
jgi:hypothetical protein